MNPGGQLRLAEYVAGSEWDPEEFDVLYRRYFPRLSRFVVRRTGDPELAEDLAQETLIRALSHLDPSSNGTTWPWLKTVASRLVVDNARRAELERTRQMAQLSPDAGSPDDGILLNEALSRLPRRQRTAVQLRYFEDWTGSDAARFLGMNRHAFEQLLWRAKDSLRREFRRVSREALGLLALPSRWLRHRFALITRGSGDGSLHLNQALIVSGQQLAAVFAALAVVATSGGGPTGTGTAPIAAGQGQQVAMTHGAEALRARGGSGGGSVGSEGSGAGSIDRPDRAPAAPTGMSGAVDDIRDPNRNVHDPEDARILSFADGGRTGTGHTMYATGVARCRTSICPPVLFVSHDAGRSWSRAEATGLQGTELAVPQGPGDGPSPIFAMGPAGLQVSEDGGRTFRFAIPTGASFATGSMAVSPGYFSGDPSVLIGAQTLLRYRSDDGSVTPMNNTALHGPFEPSFFPLYPQDPRVAVGGLTPDPVSGYKGALYICNRSVCLHHVLPIEGQAPKVEFSDDFYETEIAYAFTLQSLFMTTDRFDSLTRLALPFDGPIQDVVALDDPRHVLVSVDGRGNKAENNGVYLTRDGGTSWILIPSLAFESGAGDIIRAGDSIVVARSDYGLACSLDGGRTWKRRCR